MVYGSPEPEAHDFFSYYGHRWFAQKVSGVLTVIAKLCGQAAQQRTGKVFGTPHVCL
jgi:hypothetical protein